jgi:hypothetical protein
MTKFNIQSSIKTKLSFRFGVLLAIFMASVAFTFFTLNTTIYTNNEINTVFTPSVKKVQDIKLLISNSKSLISSWIFVQSDNNNPEKVKLNKLIDTEYPLAKEELLKLSTNWNVNDKASLDSVFLEVESLFGEYKKVKTVLSTFDSYNDPMLIFEVTPMMQEQGTISQKFNQIIKDLDKIAVTQVKNSETAILSMTTLLNRFKFFIIFIAIGTVILGVFITINTVRSLIKPITEVKDSLVKMGNGEISDTKLVVGKDELGEMSAALNYLSDGLKDTAAYADKIGNGDFNASFKPLSENDLLGNSLLEMGKKLKVLGEEDRKRNWVTAGLAKFADILRSSSEVSELSDEIISNIVKYLGANQGGIFLLKEEGNETVLELTACYAYERKKFLEKIIREGEGLLGQCLLEKDTIYLTEVPNDYIQITSGTGGANPNCIVIQPLIVNDEMVGVIELASFKVMDKFEMEFIKKLAENIAGVISNVKVNERTVHLLDEARTAQESMRSQEEELRQNLEELTATQEEMFRKEQEYLSRIKELESKVS